METEARVGFKPQGKTPTEANLSLWMSGGWWTAATKDNVEVNAGAETKAR